MTRKKVGDLVKHKGIKLLQYSTPFKSALSGLILKPLTALQIPTMNPHKQSIDLDLVWYIGWFVTDDEQQRPN